VIDGAIRDADALATSEFPVYACGVTHRGPYKDGPGEINVTVTIAGMIVNPGDIIVGDADGIVAIPQSEAERILALTQAQKAKEDATLAAIAAGKPIDRSWVDKMLRDKGCSLP
jgi:regulator of RNase E activity RraA